MGWREKSPAGGWSHHLGTSRTPSQPDCCLATPGLQVTIIWWTKDGLVMRGVRAVGLFGLCWKLTSTRADWDAAGEGGLDSHRWSSPGESPSPEPSG